MELELNEAEARGRKAGLEEAIKYVTWSMKAKGDQINPAAKAAYEEAILTIETADMPRSTVPSSTVNSVNQNDERK